MTRKRPFRPFFFVDGYTLKKVNEFYRFYHPFHSRIDFRSLKNWARREAVRLFSPQESYALMECHYYHPYKDPGRCAKSYGMLSFMRELRHVGFQVHFNERVMDGLGPNMGLFNDALLFADYGRMDAAVLLSTQGEFAQLPDRLQMRGIPTLLLGWNFSYPKDDRIVRWKTDSGLMETSTYYVTMDRVAERNAPYYAAPGCLFGSRVIVP
ncbi:MULTISPECIES: NYN domain-containing protein [unclassified Fibrobacter]|uniref:NYN domain-containing protein n=1 Tax=unclassified Fibrobacter TaxID=2634177 RepID=UPI001566D5CB|nr:MULTISPECIES: NYN domain-containing protein [unclassified Fibrobacter]